METHILIGNFIALISAIVMICNGFVKNKKKIFYIQIIQMLLAGLCDFILGSVSGLISNLIGCVRNVLCYKDKFGLVSKIIVSIFAAGFILYFNNLGWVGLLPLFSMLIYIAFMNTGDIIKFKMLIIVSILPWIIHDFYIKSYVYAIFDIGSVITNLISIYQIKKLEKVEV